MEIRKISKQGEKKNKSKTKSKESESGKTANIQVSKGPAREGGACYLSGFFFFSGLAQES